MQRSNSAEVIAVRPKPARRRVNSYVKQMIFAAAVVLCAAAVAGAQTVTTLYNFVGGKKSGANSVVRDAGASAEARTHFQRLAARVELVPFPNRLEPESFRNL
jgi:hypothetical protein